MVDNDCFLIDFQGAIVHFTDTDTSDILVIIDGTDQYLCAGIRITGWRRNIVYDRLEERRHIFLLIIEVVHGISISCGCIDEWAVKLLVRSIQIHEKL